MTQIQAALEQYDELGFDTIPLWPGTKKPYGRDWQNRSPNRLWQNAPDGANIGIRGGGDACAAFIDCDDKTCKGTFETVTHYLAGLGYQDGDYPIVQTASGVGRHIYVTFTGKLPGDSRNLSPDMGAGEFRYGSGAQVAAPPSELSDGGGYRLINGNLARLPHLDLSDILRLVGNQDTTPPPPRKIIPRRALALLHGKNTEGFKSNSEAEQSLIASLINAGYSFGEVLDLFNQYQCAGKYAELRTQNTKNAERWLNHSYTKAAEWAHAHESKARQTVTAAIAWAESTTWAGRTGAVDRLIFLAHMDIAYKAGRLEWAAACRDLAERAAVSAKTAINSNHRLCDGKVLTLETAATVDCANVYRLPLDKVTHFLSTSFVRKCVTLSINHDLFRFGGLGKRAGQVWQILQEHPATVDELAEITGASAKTITRALSHMAKLADTYTGECLPMVASNDDETWHALDADLDRLALIVGTAGKGKRQKKQHADERRKHNRELRRGRVTAEC
jgi:hypothetical protein